MSDHLSPVCHIQTLLDPIEATFDSIDTSCLTRDLRLEMANLGHDMPHCGLERGDPRLELRHIGFSLIDDTPNVPEMLKHYDDWGGPGTYPHMAAG